MINNISDDPLKPSVFEIYLQSLPLAANAAKITMEGLKQLGVAPDKMFTSFLYAAAQTGVLMALERAALMQKQGINLEAAAEKEALVKEHINFSNKKQEETKENFRRIITPNGFDLNEPA